MISIGYHILFQTFLQSKIYTRELHTTLRIKMAPVVIYPAKSAPSLVLQTLDGDTFDLKAVSPKQCTIVVFYRGLHCPLCKLYLKEIEEHFDDSTTKGMEVIAVSMDSEETARQTASDVSMSLGGGQTSLLTKIGYGLTEDQARSWGLYMSSKCPGTSEPDIYGEPGLFVVQPDGTVFFAQVQSGPFTRPAFGQLLGYLQFAFDNNYPIRGDLTMSQE